MSNPVDTAFPTASPGTRGAVASYLKSGVCNVVTSVTELQGLNLTGYRLCVVLSTGRIYKYDAASTAADDGSAVLVDADGNRFVLVSNGTLSAQDMADLIAAATAKTTPVDADMLGIADSAASNALKKLTFANLWAWVKSKLAGTDPLTIGGLLVMTGYQWVTGSLAGTTVPAPASNIQVSVIWDTHGPSASMTLTLPSGPVNGQVIEFAYINSITSLAFTGGSILGYGGAAAVPGGGFTKFVYNSAFGVWARLGD